MTDEAPTDADIIGQYIKIRDFIDKKSTEFEETLKPYKDAMTALEGTMSQRLIERKGNSVTTESGIAYRSAIMSAKVADSNVFFDWVFKDNRRGFITIAVTKDAVKEYMEAGKVIENGKEKTGPPPPGIDVTWIFKTNFRKPT